MTGGQPRQLISELAAMNLSPKLVTNLEALDEARQDRVLQHVNSGMKIRDAYQRVAGEKTTSVQPEAQTQTPESEATVATGTPAEATAPETAKPAKARKAPKAKQEAKPKKLSAIDAAARVLGETGEPMNCQDMIKAMAEKGYWTSPGGKTPAATLYSVILRELQTKGNEARFKKTERGKFAGAKAS